MSRYGVIEAVLLVGFAVVLPLALGRHRRAWWVAALAIAIGVQVEGHVAAAFALPALVCSGIAVVEAIARREVVALVVAMWVSVASGAVAFSLGGWELLGIGEPIVRLTAVHYLFAGVGALTLAERVRAGAPAGSRTRRAAEVGVVATALAPPVVATGFVLESPLPQVGGAVMMTVGVWATALALLSLAREWHGWRRVEGLGAGLAVWVPMVLAVCWAAANHWAGVPALSIPDMARTHGVINGLGFVVLGLLGTQCGRECGRAVDDAALTGGGWRRG